MKRLLNINIPSFLLLSASLSGCVTYGEYNKKIIGDTSYITRNLIQGEEACPEKHIIEKRERHGGYYQCKSGWKKTAFFEETEKEQQKLMVERQQRIIEEERKRNDRMAKEREQNAKIAKEKKEQQAKENAIKIANLKQKAESGDVAAMTNLGKKYSEGDGVPQNDKEAARWTKKAAEQGYARAQCNLGIMYKNGKGVPQSDEEAIEWVKKAAAQGYEKAKAMLEGM